MPRYWKLSWPRLSWSLAGVVGVLAVVLWALAPLTVNGRSIMVLGTAAVLWVIWAYGRSRPTTRAKVCAGIGLGAVVVLGLFASPLIDTTDYAHTLANSDLAARTAYTQAGVVADGCKASKGGLINFQPSVHVEDGVCVVALDVEHNHITLLPGGKLSLSAVTIQHTHGMRILEVRYPATAGARLEVFLYDPGRAAISLPEQKRADMAHQLTYSATGAIVAQSELHLSWPNLPEVVAFWE